ncbi:MAG TPA: small ribosomal subunit Rsm22 family protein [Chlamydiales bacterium]|nr:small ribosomal subunit Rsm22 family protein [Chlamydiales bacterium]
MQLPEELQTAIDHIAKHSPALGRARAALTQDYKEGRTSPFSDEAKRLAYLGARLPATYAAVHKALQNCPPFTHLLDLGAGPGTASWAAADLFPLTQITLIEKSPEAIALGKTLAAHSTHPALQSARWIQQSLADPLPTADAAILSYVLNEIGDPVPLIERLWKAVPLLILVEPGTPKGFAIIRKARTQLISLGAHLLAPCPHAHACPVQGSDWCHFSARVERTRLHRLLKEGSLGYEDEKFSYLIASKTAGPSVSGRIVRHPLKQSGHVRVALCTAQGKLEEKVITRKDKESYRKARDAEWGDVPAFDF